MLFVLSSFCLISLVVDSIAIDCPLAAQTFSEIQSRYQPWNRQRVWQIKCRKIAQHIRETCQDTAPIEQGPNDWNVTCPWENGYVRGITLWYESSRRYFKYRVNCCATSKKQIIPETCVVRSLFKAGESATVSIEDGVVTGFFTQWDENTRDRSFFARVCHFEQDLKIQRDTYVKYPSNQLESFGDFTHRCPKGRVVTSMESVWGFHNKDRGIHVECGAINEDEMPCSGKKYRYPEGTFRDFVRPRSWMTEGCQGQEVLTELQSAIIDNTRRYIFGCCQLKQPLINTASCQYVRVSNGQAADWGYTLPKGHVFRGISAQWDQESKDRTNVYLEVCSIKADKLEKQPEVEVGCPESQVVYGVHSKFIRRRAFTSVRQFRLQCRYMPFSETFGFNGENGKAECATVVSSNNTGTTDYMMMCPENMQMTGLQWTKAAGYHLRCCKKSGVEIIPSTCYEHSKLPFGNFNANFSEFREVIVGIMYDKDYPARPGKWIFRVCSCNSEISIDKLAFDSFPLGYPIKYGRNRSGSLASTFSYSTTCFDARGKETVKTIDSVYGRLNKDRGIYVQCGIPAKSASQRRVFPILTNLRYDHPEGDEGATVPPKNWTTAGCRGQEALARVDAWIEPGDDVRRYKFGCAIIGREVIDGNKCYWREANTKTELHFAFFTDDTEIIRGVRSTFDPVSKLADNIKPAEDESDLLQQ